MRFCHVFQRAKLNNILIYKDYLIFFLCWNTKKHTNHALLYINKVMKWVWKRVHFKPIRCFFSWVNRAILHKNTRMPINYTLNFPLMLLSVNIRVAFYIFLHIFAHFYLYTIRYLLFLQTEQLFFICNANQMLQSHILLGLLNTLFLFNTSTS